MRSQVFKRVFKICLLTSLFVLIGIRLFYKLGSGALEVTDEAWYGVNAYEMLGSGNWLVPTRRHLIDYASKPPLGLWGILLGFKIFGVNLTGLRMYSAVSGLLTIILICDYLYRRYGIRHAIVAAGAFSALWQCFEIHMFRAGDMDALFCLFYAIAIIALAEVARGRSQMLVFYGLAVGLGFMTKSMHVTVALLVGALFLPMIWKKITVKEVLIAAFAGLLPNIIWIVARFPVDGLTYLKSITLGEASDQTKRGFTFEYLRDVSREKVTWVLLALLFIRVVLYFVGFVAKDREGNIRKFSGQQVWRDFLGWCKDKYLLILAFLVPILFYSLADHHMMWYIDPAYIAVVWIIANETAEVSDKLRAYAGRLGTVLTYGVVAFCMFYACVQIMQYSGLGTGGRAIDQFRSDMTEFRNNTYCEYDGTKAYIAYDRERHVGDRGHWELDFVFLGNANAGLECVDGGVEGFLADDNSLLVMDSELWGEYADVLTGYVFLEQNTYYVLSHDRY